MSKLTRINVFYAILLLLMSFAGIRDAYSNSQKYGWSYTQYTIIETDFTETVVSVGYQVFASVFLGLLGIVLVFNNRFIGEGYTLDIRPLKEGDITGIVFPKGNPEFWDLGVDLNTSIVDVAINEYVISFPLSLIHGWIEKHEKKKLEDMK